MEANLREVGTAAVAPVAWGTTYYVTRHYLPAGNPLWGAALRALPAGCLLMLLARTRPRGEWLWRSAVLGLLNTSAFFVLVYIAAQRLATSTASTVMALSPLVMTVTAWALLAQRPRAAHLAAGVTGLAGVVLMMWGRAGGSGTGGLIASVAAMLVSSVGYVLSQRWDSGAGVLATTAWQLCFGGVLLLVAAVVSEGAPPPVDAGALLAFGYVTVVATALAFLAWFAALRRLPAATVGLIGLLNPVTGVLLGTVLAAESLTGRRLAGMGLILAGVLLARPRGTHDAEGAPARPGQPSGRAAAPARDG
ncbi:DMT family transporter [Streptomyces sp. NBC_00102]|uniref:DMT family transporter n=1 Tax=Streptomyces sp. NBC_00102 TaxID=2975652 RepID=UPI002255AB82|nr:EamA family transporter [Streptomyces sp. NBC_00102]MCX5400365.1 EamA family transporter [Streptomyces sp. NBC_00102]